MLQNSPNIFTYVITNKLWNCRTVKDIFHISWQTNVSFELITHFTKCIRKAKDINNLMGRVRDFAWGFKLFTILEVLSYFLSAEKFQICSFQLLYPPKMFAHSFIHSEMCLCYSSFLYIFDAIQHFHLIILIFKNN